MDSTAMSTQQSELNEEKIPVAEAVLEHNQNSNYRWVIFLGTVFFQILIPSLIVNFGIFLTFSKLKTVAIDEKTIKLWDDKLIYAPLIFSATATLFDPMARILIKQSKWPRLVSVAGTCLTCAGLLIMVMGMDGANQTSMFVSAGFLAGLGAAIQTSQCEILLAQYFKTNLVFMSHITQAVIAFGCIISPIILGHYIIETSLFHVALWYAVTMFQGILVAILFRKPRQILQQKRIYSAVFDRNNLDDEEDIFSKSNMRELQFTARNTDLIKNIEENVSSGSGVQKHHDWEKFESDSESSDYGVEQHPNYPTKELQENWVNFEESINRTQNLQSEINEVESPAPLFTQLEPNNNITYSFEEDDYNLNRTQNSGFDSVFVPNNGNQIVYQTFELLKQLTFYKSLLTFITMKFSQFTFYTLFPTYLFERIEHINLKSTTKIVGVLSTSTLMFALLSYWINIDKKRRAIALWFLCWVGSAGYIMLSDSNSESGFILGAMQVITSIATIQNVGGPILGLTVQGSPKKEYGLISTLTAFSFSFFLIINSTFKECFRFLALLHFVTGFLWFLNYVYKKIRGIE